MRVGLVVEEAEREDDVERALERRRPNVAVNELDLVAEACQSLLRQVEHLLGDIGVDVLAGAGLERELADAARAPADVEDARRRVFPDDVDREIAALQQPGASRPLERMLFVVEGVKRGCLLAKVISDELRSVRRLLHVPPRS